MGLFIYMPFVFIGITYAYVNITMYIYIYIYHVVQYVSSTQGCTYMMQGSHLETHPVASLHIDLMLYQM